MSAGQHSPGPWVYSEQSNAIKSSVTGKFVVSMNDVSPDDILLIAIAPQLLCLLQETLKPGAYGIGSTLATRIDAVVTALTGEQQ